MNISRIWSVVLYDIHLSSCPGICCTNHPTWELIQDDWLALSEFEVILTIAKFTTTLAQTETYMMGEFSTVIKSITSSKLRNDTISVVILPEVTQKNKATTYV